jgi:hypothetical protein
MLHARMTLAIAALTVAVAVGATSTDAYSDDASPREVARLRLHFDSVLGELRAADVSRLTAPQNAARATLIRRLEQYSAAGRFPHNHVRPGQIVPVFRDEHGTLCAMGFLIASTGRNDIVEHVTTTNNLVYIRDLANDASLRRWLDSTGLTLAEAARIQPSYDGGGCCTIPDPEPVAVRDATARRNYAIVSVGGTAISGAAMLFNLASASSRHRLGTWLGLVSGSAQVAYGAYAVEKHDGRSGIGVANIAIGATSAAIATWRMRQPRPEASGVAVSVAPYATQAGALGLSFSARM